MFQCLSIFLLSSLFIFSAQAWQWSDLWMTKDQKAQELMKKENYLQARDTFQRYDWKASAAFRAKDYKNAAKWFSRFHDEDGYYNTGNAFAFLGDFKQAIQAYDQALALNPKHSDAMHNKKIVQKLLKKQQAQNQKNKNQKDKNQQGKDQQGKDPQGQDRQGQDPQGKDQQGKDQQGKDLQGKDPQGKDQQGKDPQGKDPQGKDPQGKDPQGQDQQDKDQPQHNQSNAATRHPKRSEGSPAAAKHPSSQDNPTWLNYIPDDPGGLLREKFLRDYLKRHQGND